jgi:hypothetical protein
VDLEGFAGGEEGGDRKAWKDPMQSGSELSMCAVVCRHCPKPAYRHTHFTGGGADRGAVVDLQKRRRRNCRPRGNFAFGVRGGVPRMIKCEGVRLVDRRSDRQGRRRVRGQRRTNWSSSSVSAQTGQARVARSCETQIEGDRLGLTLLPTWTATQFTQKFRAATQELAHLPSFCQRVLAVQAVFPSSFQSLYGPRPRALAAV